MLMLIKVLFIFSHTLRVSIHCYINSVENAGLATERKGLRDAIRLFLRYVTVISGLTIPVCVLGAFSMEEYARLLTLRRH